MTALTDLKAILIYILAALVLVLGLSTWEYRRMFKATDFALTMQNAAIKRQNEAAADLLKKRTSERDALQAQLDKRAAAQRKTDDQGKAQITSDSKRDAATPVRVHYVSRDAGGGGGCPASGAAAAAQLGGGDASAAGGVLAPEAAELFKRDQDAVERLQLAFNSCRATVMLADPRVTDYALPRGNSLAHE